MYKRVIVLEARDDPSGEPFLVLKPSLTDGASLRIRVEMESNIAQQLAQARVMIYNLSLQNSQRLCAGDPEAKSTGDAKTIVTTKKVHVTIKAGYEDEIAGDLSKLPVVITGWVMNSYSKRYLPNFITTLYVLPISSGFLELTFPAFYTAESDTLKQVLTKMCNAVGFSTEAIKFYIGEKIEGTVMRGKTIAALPDLYGTLTRMADIYNFVFAMTASGISFYPKPDDSAASRSEFNHLMDNGEAYLIHPELVRSPPEFSMMTLQVVVNADSQIQPGWVIDVRSLVGKGTGDTSLPSEGIAGYDSVGRSLFLVDDVSKYGIYGKYMASRVSHVLDNYSEDWHTQIMGIVPAPGNVDKKQRAK